MVDKVAARRRQCYRNIANTLDEETDRLERLLTDVHRRTALPTSEGQTHFAASELRSSTARGSLPHGATRNTGAPMFSEKKSLSRPKEDTPEVTVGHQLSYGYTHEVSSELVLQPRQVEALLKVFAFVSQTPDGQADICDLISVMQNPQ